MIVLPTLDEFLKKRKTGSYLPSNSYVIEQGFASLYVRLTTRYIHHRTYDPVLDIANVESEQPGKGTFTKLIERLRREYPHLGLYVESVLNVGFRGKLLSLGFEYVGPHTDSPCYFLTPTQGEVDAREASAQEK